MSERDCRTLNNNQQTMEERGFQPLRKGLEGPWSVVILR